LIFGAGGIYSYHWDLKGKTFRGSSFVLISRLAVVKMLHLLVFSRLPSIVTEVIRKRKRWIQHVHSIVDNFSKSEGNGSIEKPSLRLEKNIKIYFSGTGFEIGVDSTGSG
jgi:hypothetical protein